MTAVEGLDDVDLVKTFDNSYGPRLRTKPHESSCAGAAAADKVSDRTGTQRSSFCWCVHPAQLSAVGPTGAAPVHAAHTLTLIVDREDHLAVTWHVNTGGSRRPTAKR